MSYNVFVYGTLRSGASNSFRMRGATSLGNATIQARLYRVHEEFPGIILSDSENDILVGEVFTEVSAPQIEALDIYEGCDEKTPPEERLYQRVMVNAKLADGTTHKAWVWEYLREVSEFKRMKSGDWLFSTLY